MKNQNYYSNQEAKVEGQQTRLGREAGLAKGGKSIVKRKQPLTLAKPAAIQIGGSAFLPNTMSHSTKNVSGQQSFEFKREATLLKKDKKKNEGPSDSAKKPGNTKNDTTGINSSTLISQNNQSNSWKKKISRDEQQSTSWFDWIMCGACSTQPELTETERKNIESKGRAPLRMDSVNTMQKKRELLDFDENLLNDGSDLKAQHAQDRRNRLQPVKNFEEFNKIIFERETVSGILLPDKNKTESDDKAAHTDFGQKLAIYSERERFDGEDESDNMMIDIDESTPVSKQTQVLYPGRVKEEQASSKGGHQFPQNVHQNQKNPQEDLNSLMNNNKTEAEPGKSFPSNQNGGQTTGGVSSNSKVLEKSLSYQHDYQKQILRTKQEEQMKYKTAISSSEKKQHQRISISTETKNNFDIHDDSSISSNKSIPEEKEETSCQLLTNQTHLSGTEVGIMTNTNAMNRASNLLTLSHSVQTAKDTSAEVLVLDSSRQASANHGEKNCRFTSEKGFSAQKPANLVAKEQQNDLIGEEYKGMTALEEDSSCGQFARLEQQIYAEENKHNRSASHTTGEVVVVSMTQNRKPSKNHHLDDDDEFFRIERECQAYQLQQYSINQPATLQEAKMAKDDQTYSNKTTPIDPKGGPIVTLAIRRHSTDEENTMAFQEQIASRALSPNIDFQIKQFDSTNKSDDELMFVDSENKLHQRDKADKRNQTSEGKKQSGGLDSQDSGPLNIQNNRVERNFNRPVHQYEYQQQLVNAASFEDSLIPSKEKPLVEQKRLPPPAKITQIHNTSSKSPQVNKKKLNTQLTFGTPQTNLEKKAAVTQDVNQQEQNFSFKSKLQTTNQQKPGTAIPKSQSKNATPVQSSISKKTANVTSTEESKSIDINSTAPNAQLGNSGQSNIGVNNKKNLALTSRQKESILENSAQSLASQSLNITKTKSSFLKTQKPVISRASLLKPDIQRSTSTLKKAAGQKSKMAEIIQKYATVATIDLTVTRQNKKTEDKSIITISQLEAPKKKDISDALHELGKSMRSSSQTSLLELRNQRSMSRQSLTRDPSSSKDLITNSIRQKSLYQNNIKNQSAQPNPQNKAIDSSIAGIPPAHNIRTSIYTDSESRTSISKKTPTIFQVQPQPVQPRRNSNYARHRRSSRAQEISEIYERYESQINSNGQQQFRNAIRQLRRAARTPSSRGQQQEGSQRNLTNTDICSDSSQLPTQKEQHSGNPFSNTSHISSKRLDLTQEHQEARDRIYGQEAQKNSPPPRISSANRRRSITKNVSQVSRQTAMFGNIDSRYSQEKQKAYGTLDGSRDLPPLPRKTTDMPHQSLKVQLIENAKINENYVHQRKISLLQSQQEFDRQRSLTVNQNLPTPEEMAKFLSYSAKSKQMVRNVSVKKIFPRNQRSAANILTVDPSPRQNKSRVKVAGFFDAKNTPGRTSVVKEAQMTLNQQMSSSIFLKKRFSVNRNKNLARSVSPMQTLTVRRMVPSQSKRSLSVRHERSQENQPLTQESPSRLSKIMSQKELTTAKKNQLERPGPSAASYNRLKLGDTPLSRNSRNSPDRDTPRKMTRLAPAGTSLKTKPKPQANTIENKKRAMLKKQSSEYAIVNVQGSIVTGIVKPIQVGGQRADERMPNNTSLTRQPRTPQNGQSGNTKIGISKKTTLVTDVKRAQNNQKNSTNQIQSSQNNNMRGNEANKIRSTAKWN